LWCSRQNIGNLRVIGSRVCVKRVVSEGEKVTARGDEGGG